VSSFQKCFWATAAAVAAMIAAPATASAHGPIRYVVARPVWRAPVAAVRTVRVVTPTYGYYYAPRYYVPAPIYVAPIGVPVIYGY
jgi:hypothetical protein